MIRNWVWRLNLDHDVGISMTFFSNHSQEKETLQTRMSASYFFLTIFRFAINLELIWIECWFLLFHIRCFIDIWTVISVFSFEYFRHSIWIHTAHYSVHWRLTNELSAMYHQQLMWWIFEDSFKSDLKTDKKLEQTKFDGRRIEIQV